ncbi:hypothetical protein LTR86_006420 [Recurvomyces mirabilis]|nr:hypothetical protein LTR86_006420 [Recurvomyces mirabilis]
MAPKLEEVMILHVEQAKDDQLRMGGTKGGAMRAVSPLNGGYLKGDNINASLVQGGSDWIKFDTASGTVYLDARVHFRDPATDSIFYFRAEGISRLDEKSALIFAWSPEAKTTQASDHYLFVSPIFEVSKEEHKWMEQHCFVGHGFYTAPGDGTQGVTFTIYKLVSA